MSSKKRTALTAAMSAATAARGKAGAGRGARSPEPEGRTASTTIAITPHVLNVLRAVAFARKAGGEGRASVSSVIADLIEKHRAELETEGRPYLPK